MTLVCYCLLFIKEQKENVSNLLRLRLPRYRQTPLPLKRVKAHALGREPSALLSWLTSIWRIYGKQESKRTLQRICLFKFLRYVTIRSYCFEGSTFIVYPQPSIGQGILSVLAQGVEERLSPSTHRNAYRRIR